MNKKYLFLILALVFLVKILSDNHLHTSKKVDNNKYSKSEEKKKDLSKKLKSASNQVRKTIQKKYKIKSSKPIKPEDLNISLSLDKKNSKTEEN